MRRWIFSLAGLGLICLVSVGCRHTAGVCDCDVEDPCAQRAPWAYLSFAESHVPEHLKEMPKANP